MSIGLCKTAQRKKVWASGHSLPHPIAFEQAFSHSFSEKWGGFLTLLSHSSTFGISIRNRESIAHVTQRSQVILPVGNMAQLPVFSPCELMD